MVGWVRGNFWKRVAILLATVMLAQWILFSVVMSHGHDLSLDASTLSSPLDVIHKDSSSAVRQEYLFVPESPTSTGVAATLMLKAPKWFARRYTVMMHNVLSNIPIHWRVQVFVNTAWLEKDVLPLHPGLRRLYGTASSATQSWTVGRVTWTPLPTDVLKKRPKDIMKSNWFWQSVIDENVFLFGGNGALCANGRASMDDFLKYDYVGAPWGKYQGRGGDGSTHSFRHRSAMLSIVENYPSSDDSIDSQYFLKYLLQDSEKFKIGERETTRLFGGFDEMENAPFLVSGAQPSLNYTMRDNLLSVCPEVKVIFPSMHEPACFGAHPKPSTCKESICALQDVLPPQGC